jgi:hypothetical protein
MIQGALPHYAEGVAQQSPGSRSAPWVAITAPYPYPNGVPQTDPQGAPSATLGFVVQRLWRKEGWSRDPASQLKASALE